MAMFLLQTAFGSALGIALAPTAKDPKLVWMYSKFKSIGVLRLPLLTRFPAGLAIATLITAGLFWFVFRGLNATEESMNSLEEDGAKAVPAGEITATGGLRHTPALFTAPDLGEKGMATSAPAYNEK